MAFKNNRDRYAVKVISKNYNSVYRGSLESWVKLWFEEIRGNKLYCGKSWPCHTPVLKPFVFQSLKPIAKKSVWRLVDEGCLKTRETLHATP